MIDPADPIFDNNQQEANSYLSKHFSPSNPIHNKHFSAQAHLYPIDESEDFHDPFSDLSLFLSKKIKQEIDKHGSSSQWSSKIESNLLAKILPEFKIHFPKYRIGVNAIKKVWEKVSYYYGKVQSHKEAIDGNGKLNLEVMIKENLRGYPFLPTNQHLPHYNIAHQIAVKISECIATLEGTKPKLDVLTKTIWSIQKHLLKNLPAKESKGIYDEYDNLDKLIVKTSLEKISEHPLICQKDLEEEILKTLFVLRKTMQSFTQEDLYHVFAILLSQNLYKNLTLHQNLLSDEKNKIEKFIKKQLSISKFCGMNPVESTQRILALYPLANCIPKTFDLCVIKKLILLSYQASVKNKIFTPSSSEGGLSTFIQAELHFLKRKEIFTNYEHVEKILIETLSHLSELPAWRENFSEEIEILAWYHLREMPETLSKENLQFLTHCLDEITFDSKQVFFKKTIYQLLDYLKKQKLLLTPSKNQSFETFDEELRQRVYTWSIQNDMICRWIHFDPNNSILRAIEVLWEEHKISLTKNFNYEALLEELEKKISHERGFNQSQSILKNRVAVLFKYFWYNHLCDPSESSFERFIKFQIQDVKFKHSSKNLDEILSIVQHRIEKALPLAPFSRKQIEKGLQS